VLKGRGRLLKAGIFSGIYGIYSMTAYFHHINLTSRYFNHIIVEGFTHCGKSLLIIHKQLMKSEALMSTMAGSALFA